MVSHEEIAEMMISELAEIFMLDKEYVKAHPELRLREDLAATSMHYFPLIAALEEKLDIEVEFHEFQEHTPTVQATIDYAIELYEAQQK